MAILEVLKFPDPRLRKLSEPVEKVTPELKKFSEDMLETMYAEKGIGLAAPQVNKLVRLLIVDTRRKDKEGRYEMEEMTDLEQKVPQPIIIFNPEIVDKEGETTFDEGCLSIPGYYETVKRFNYVEIKGLDPEGKELNIKTDGLTAICIQHEIDHLDGKLFIDRLSIIKSNRVKKQIKKHGYPDKKTEENGDDHVHDENCNHD